MKISGAIILSLGLFVASCSAACNCKATDQACLDKCVTAANKCIVECDTTGGNACQQACLASNWPSMADVTKKIVFEEESTIAEDASEPTASADEKSVQGAEATTTAASADAKSTASHASSLSGGTTAMSGSTASTKPTFNSAASSNKPTASSSSNPPKNNMDTTSDSSRHAAIGWTVSMVVVIGTAAWIL